MNIYRFYRGIKRIYAFWIYNDLNEEDRKEKTKIYVENIRKNGN